MQIFTPSINTGTSIIHANYMNNGPNTNTTIDSNISATMAGSIAEVVWEIVSYRDKKQCSCHLRITSLWLPINKTNH